MTSVVSNLEEIARLARGSADLEKIGEAIKKARAAIKDEETPSLRELGHELEIWQSKLSVILKEPIGRQGMVKHVRFWVEKLKCQTS